MKLIKLTGYGRKEWLGSGIIAILLLGLSIPAAFFLHSGAGWTISALIVIVWLALAAFFRDPHRRIPEDPSLLVSPADGVIRDIELLDDIDDIEGFKGKKTVRVGIFLSVLDVHLNRAPSAFSVEDRKYREGRFHDARNPDAIKENESLTLSGTASVEDISFPMAVKQISGAIARRIVCEAVPGDELEKGAIYGMIKFGSRTELYLPARPDISVAVKVGDRVFAGTTVIARKTRQVPGKEKIKES